MGANAFASALGDAIERRSATLVHLRARLQELGTPVSLSTLSYWRSGERQPEGAKSVAAIENLERVLGVDPGHLTRLLDPAQLSHVRRRGTIDVLDSADKVELVLHELGDLDPTHLTELSTHLLMDVDIEGDMRRFRYRTVWRAAVDGVRGAPIVIVLDPPIGPAQLTELEGCRLGRTAVSPCEVVNGFELLFPRPLREGEHSITEIAGTLPPGLDDPEMHHGLLTPIHELLLWVRFDPRRVPARAESFIGRDGDIESEPLPFDGHTIFTRNSHVGPGRIGIRWEW